MVAEWDVRATQSHSSDVRGAWGEKVGLCFIPGVTRSLVSVVVCFIWVKPPAYPLTHSAWAKTTGKRYRCENRLATGVELKRHRGKPICAIQDLLVVFT